MNNKLKIAIPAVGIHLSIGSVYAWSQIAASIYSSGNAGWSLTQITFAFSLSIFFLGLTSAVMGSFVEKKGPKLSGIMAAFFFGLGLFCAGLSVKYQSLLSLYLSYGLLGGIGIGLGYITPVSTLLKWFPDRKGLAMGIVIMGFGFGAAFEIILLQSVLPWLNINTISSSLMVLGIFYFTVMLCCACFLKSPKKDPISTKLLSVDLKKAVKMKEFYCLWLMLFINVTCGIGLISVAKFMGLEIIHLSAARAALMVMLMSIFNGLGRIFWANISDYISRPITFILFFCIQMVAFYFLGLTTQPFIFMAIIFLVLTCYGGGFAVVPAFVGDVFGCSRAGAIHGLLLSAWASAGLLGPTIISKVRDVTGNYQLSLDFFIVILFIGFLISLFMHFSLKKQNFI